MPTGIARDYVIGGMKLQALLYVAHGSRVREGNREAVQFIESVKPFFDVDIQEHCFLELAEPSILKGVEKCVSKGATRIAVIPILLLSANHMKIDIPSEIEKAKTYFPFVDFTIGKPLGVHEKLIYSLHSRVMAQCPSPPGETDILLIGRGSSDPHVQKDLDQIAKLLQQTYHYAKVDTCFLYGNGPLFEEKLPTLCESQNRVFIIPYLLFTGLLKLSIQKKVAKQGFSSRRVVLCDCLGYDENVRQVFIQRIEETLYSFAGSG